MKFIYFFEKNTFFCVDIQVKFIFYKALLKHSKNLISVNMNIKKHLDPSSRRISRVYSYTEEDIENIVMQYFLLNHDEELPEHFVANIKFLNKTCKSQKSKSKINVYVR